VSFGFEPGVLLIGAGMIPIARAMLHTGIGLRAR
jgi:hypothetical protein